MMFSIGIHSLVAQVPAFQFDTLLLPGQFIHRVHTDTLGNVWAIAGQDRRTVYLISSCGKAIDRSAPFHQKSEAPFTAIIAMNQEHVMVGTKGDYILEYQNGSVSVRDSSYGVGHPVIHQLLYLHYSNTSNSYIHVGTPYYAYISEGGPFTFSSPWGSTLTYPEIFVLGSRHNYRRGWGYIYAYRRSHSSGNPTYRTIRFGNSGMHTNSWYFNGPMVDTILTAESAQALNYPHRAYVSLGTPNFLIREQGGNYHKHLIGKRVNKILTYNDFMLAGTDQGLFISTTPHAMDYDSVNLPQVFDIQDIDYTGEVVFLATAQGLVRMIDTVSCASPSIEVSIISNGDTLFAQEATGSPFRYQWFRNGEPIWQAWDSWYVPTADGAYSVGISSECISCLAQSPEFQVGVPTSRDTRIEYRLSVYPNPVSNYLIVKLPPHFQGEARLRIRSVHGAEISPNWKQDSRQEIEISVSHLPDGMYFLELHNQENVFLTTTFLKQ